ncbi:binding-protein-dependent transport systems inner membrane component [Thermoanaerobacterium thermosaccharolyticum DSM 571]|uniref:Binding-protein-dependent transport systems inner membrane component n=1 Tax=Thermoanaerobacterium thermosaccharolyticum (strain ATCC 7956 / DSM 571 / NCIMB 9385 / NCA 3814 / NCTC 13789 / WDCM 00135 / 2032) TaxID=580327 RepID=D9TNG9_THETC|nr:carbohydrate ABC transporter permease [Thermoanaerobacterium thermosaccharolyticum]ADL68575.1 binding-protein-dependent transport systems inner membrane component [Thermoanaerobacterium thermosaccharolyticum DSM 571]TCW41881.1 carbohydrate ABC transporter membrane protein 2 (CUT1 family) [Thermohydrogenium kirishiense]
MEKAKRGISILEIFGWILTLFVIFPVYIMVINSFKDRKEIFTSELSLPSSLNFTYYIQAIQKMNFLTALGNSLFITVTSVVFIIILSSMAAWVLERNKTTVSNVIFYTLVATMLIPFQSVMIPLVQYLSKWQIPGINFSLIDTRYGLIFMNIGFGIGMSTFLFHGFIKNVPLEMEEAATIDGCSKFQLFWRIVFPNLKPIIVTVAILNVISLWNDYLLPSLVLRSPNLRTIPLSTFFFFGEFTIEWNLALAGLVLTIIPVIIFYLFSQKYIIKGVMAGAIK